MSRAYTVTEFCDAYRVGRTTAYALIAQGRLRSVTVGRKRLIRADDAEKWLASLTGSEGQGGE